MNQEKPIPFGRPMFDESERDAVAEVLSGTTLVHGPVSKAFEQAFAERIGTRHAISLSSCTAGLHLSLFAKGIGPGDKVVVPAMTHVATAHAVEYCGAEPVFVDVDPESGNIDPEGVAAALDDTAVKAVMVVHYLGLPCEMTPIKAATGAAGAFIVEDCALSVDADYGGAKAGSIGLTGCFSFYPIKHITSVEGGMVTTNDDDVAAQIAKRKAFGYDQMLGQRAKPGIYDVDALGYNYRMSEVHAAVGLAQLGKLDDFQARRAENFEIVRASLAEIEEVTVFAAKQGKATSSHYCLNAVLPRDGRIDRDNLVARLKTKGIGTSVHYPMAVPLMAYYRGKYGYREGQFPIAEWLAAQTISLPVGPHLNEGDAVRIGAAFREAITK